MPVRPINYVLDWFQDGHEYVKVFDDARDLQALTKGLLEHDKIQFIYADGQAVFVKDKDSANFGHCWQM